MVLALDDYHVIETRPLHDAMSFLLEHLPPQAHLVISSRADPPFPLARLRARGEVTELRVSDLRFTPAEAGAFLSDGMGLDLSTADVVALEVRTEGWIAGLQLAARSLQGHQDATALIRTFAGDPAMSRMTSLTRFCVANRTICAISCSKPPYSTGSPGRSATS
jgi:LuxR family maltose regulon positive regulatory protein